MSLSGLTGRLTTGLHLKAPRVPCLSKRINPGPRAGE